MDGVRESELIGSLRVATAIESDYSLAELLIEFADRYPVEGALRDAFLEALDGIESRHAHDRVSSVLVGR